ncbi:HET-domain-containing protein [Annulohypoxylon truncatum]|uniref:HET-domain-containing protein n=1 Tax=Annulohypoxylon truncatum TaxID=327061 RepID=UPI002007D829|nr:HET-domain-containing protein [Annulohypoxylon truncatum]KAI1206813.1 HET-domain-containing protein [Annulohypoxylon truncatum]
MRLINVKTLELGLFYGSQTPRYAILSHTWDGDNEVTFQEWERRTDSAVRRKSGYAKIVGACRRAEADGLQYLWCDTNCIDKSSSAELSEAINSMFSWYHDSAVCYAYLADVQAKTGTLAKSRWFTRGWTLQELLAPSRVIFFDHCWTVLGDRSILAGVISDITRVHVGALENRETIRDYSIAQRMSWAADRQTSRSEDIAYCLLGIFDINMPLLYGEGSKAFTRLQLEIIKISDDQSILAWDLEPSQASLFTSALARSPTQFRSCGSIVRNHEPQQSAYSITNLGISMRLVLIKTLIGGIVLVGLNCAKELYRVAPHPNLPHDVKLRKHFRVWIPLTQLKHDTYGRLHHPASRVFLEQSYPTFSRLAPTSLFLTLNASQPQLQENPTKPLRHHSPDTPSGVLLTVASGNMTPRFVFKEVYPLGDISVVQLKGRGISTTSHLLIACDDLSVFLSVFWGKDGSPQDWTYSTIFDPQLKISNQMACLTEWKCLFETNGHKRSSSCCNNTASMHSLHKRLQHTYGNSLDVYVREERDPMVIIGDQPLMDLFGQQELLVDIIFRQLPKRIKVG